MTEQSLTPQPADIATELGHASTDTTAAYTLPALAVACPACSSEPGALCTSHGGARVRRHDVHQARTKAYNDRHAETAQPRTSPGPAATVGFILDRLDRGKTPSGTELRSLRSCVAELVRQASLADSVTAKTKELLARRTLALRERAKRAEASLARVHELADEVDDQAWRAPGTEVALRIRSAIRGYGDE
ncbi:zinc finger domain-containing protein [Actinacidiphila epipremni]|uniref:DNA-binding phage zinc finger domain-containing protein n=1 Tax=Actinacidiphila epipremni TaxID=2053013 RepID=A0ABX0ZHM9_9ACTN|nr:hypothetical protein [Actinacidiphila epipremni]NJP42296.1 hypothetical protein [Actinacidiphila epipremni]